LPPVEIQVPIEKGIPPVLVRIAKCESDNNHIDPKTGQVLMRANADKTVDVGRYQINSVWFKKATELGLDVTKDKDNETMAVIGVENWGAKGNFSKYGDFGDGNGTQTWVNTNENKNDSSLDHLDPFFYPHHDSTERGLLRNYNLTSSTGASRDDWRKYSDVGRGNRVNWNGVGEENNDSSDSRRNCSDSNDESCTISGGKKTRRKKYRKVRQIKRKTKRHRKTKKYYKKKYSKRR
jgi:hypothetical protein